MPNVGEKVFYRKDDTNHRAQVTRVDGEKVDLVLHDEGGSILCGVPDVPLAKTEADKKRDGHWWPGK